MLFESEKVEFKSQMLEDLYKEVLPSPIPTVASFILELTTQGNLTGIDHLDDTYTRITNGIVTPFSLMSLCLFAMFSRITR